MQAEVIDFAGMEQHVREQLKTLRDNIAHLGKFEYAITDGEDMSRADSLVAHEINAGTMAVLQKNERELAVALKLIESRSPEYGFCEECGEFIGERRLKLLPATRFCVDCMDKV